VNFRGAHDAGSAIVEQPLVSIPGNAGLIAIFATGNLRFGDLPGLKLGLCV